MNYWMDLPPLTALQSVISRDALIMLRMLRSCAALSSGIISNPFLIVKNLLRKVALSSKNIAAMTAVFKAPVIE